LSKPPPSTRTSSDVVRFVRLRSVPPRRTSLRLVQRGGAPEMDPSA
jgi:hypothetical protein